MIVTRQRTSLRESIKAWLTFGAIVLSIAIITGLWFVAHWLIALIVTLGAGLGVLSLFVPGARNNAEADLHPRG